MATFKFEINLLTGMSATLFQIDDVAMYKEELDNFRTSDDYNKIKGEIEVTLFSNEIDIGINGVSNMPFRSGSFNITIGGKKLFSEDQELNAGQNARFEFTKNNLELPEL